MLNNIRDFSMQQRTADTVSQALKVLANADRLRLMCAMSRQELCVAELANATGIGQPTLSQQLGVLRKANLVSTRRAGKSIFYGIADARILRVMSMLYEEFCPQEVSND